MITSNVNTGSTSTLSNDKIVGVLNDLIETCRDGQKGFQEAAEGVKDPSIKNLFQSYSRQREQFCTELQSQVRRLGGDPEKTGHVSAALHRGWMNLKAALTGNDEKAIIDEAERGEDAAMNAFRNALKENLPTDIRSIVERQFSLVKESHERVRTMKHAREQQKQQLRA